MSGELWRRRVEGDAVRSLSVDADRVVVSTGRCTVAFDRDGQILEVTEVQEARAFAPPAWLDCRSYRLSEGALVWYDAEDRTTSRSVVPLEPFAVHGERLAVTFGEMTGDKIRRWHEYVFLLADPERKRLIFAGYSIPPWMGALRPDGSVEWVRVMGKNSDCCGDVAVVSSGEGTLAHHSGCGNRLTFLDVGGAPLSVHELTGPSSGLATEGRGLAYLSFLDEGVAAFRPNQGRVWTLDVPGLSRAVVRDGIIYAVTDDRQGDIALSAFAEPAHGAE